MNVLHLMSCRGWSSDAYWAARVSRELARRGHTVTLGCRAGTDEKVIARARREGIDRIAVFDFGGGLRPGADVADVRRLARALPDTHVVHVHRGKEHWLAAIANRLGRVRRPLVRTRHIVQAVRPHAGNRWLYGHATDLVVAVSDAIRRQYMASALLPPTRVVTLHGAVDADVFAARPADPTLRARLGATDDRPLLGLVAGLRVMKGHGIVVDALTRLQRRGSAPQLAFVGKGRWDDRIRALVKDAGLQTHVTMTGFASDVAAVMSAIDIALYAPLESEGMSRVVFEYLAAGRALIAARTGVVPEILRDGEHALVVPAGDPAALADAITRLVGDGDLRARLGAAGRTLVETQYSGARLAERLESLYRALTATAA